MAKRKRAKEQEEFEDTKVVIRIHKSKKDRQHNSPKKRYKRKNNDHTWSDQIKDNMNWYLPFSPQ
jgi:hypothetical protein